MNTGGQVVNHIGRVDQLEDRYLGMVEAPSSNLGTSTPLLLIEIYGVGHAEMRYMVCSFGYVPCFSVQPVHCELL